ncbi:hypothetical protein MUN76_03520 [Leucobacter rhizosphaerae]|uniref:Uncharacterized protein n=1 Tax=Leucobacter rhizosphaerae TaxID=2932245 RepID=A0ABY4FXM9_9MICO|nr:hypothetical protein [Leucobacter rhizosphaerae]UOQ61056.1 hypothetical protein MUN76_03520 [Leucobacter rhizosphaerae]
MHRPTPLDLVDVLVYLVVLGTFTQLFPAVISESFLASLVTAVLFKVVLEVAVAGKTQLIARIRDAERPTVRIGAAIGLIIVAAGSKALILWLTDLVLGDAVVLGGFFSVTLLVVTLMLARTGVRALLQREGSASKP